MKLLLPTYKRPVQPNFLHLPLHQSTTSRTFIMSTPSPAIIKDRVESGLYDAIGEQIVAMETAALAGAEYNRDYKRRIEGWSGNYIYRDTKGTDFRTIIVGQIQGYDAGTILCAKGNHYPGPKGSAVSRLCCLVNCFTHFTMPVSPCNRRLTRERCPGSWIANWSN